MPPTIGGAFSASCPAREFSRPAALRDDADLASSGVEGAAGASGGGGVSATVGAFAFGAAACVADNGADRVCAICGRGAGDVNQRGTISSAARIATPKVP